MSKVWIAGGIHGGTSVTLSTFVACGLDRGDNGYEHTPVVQLNDRIIAELYEPGRHVQWARQAPRTMFLSAPAAYTILSDMAKLFPKLPEVVKDPRWGLTLPFWVPVCLPEHLVIITRNSYQCACAMIGAKKGEGRSRHYRVEDVAQMMRLRFKELREAGDLAAKKGCRVHYLEYPHFLQEDRKTFFELLKECTGAPDDKILSAMDNVIDPDKIQIYPGART